MLELYRPSLRASGAIAVLLAWLASLGWLAHRRLERTEAATLTSEASLRLAPGTVWYALFAGSTQIGNAGITLDTLSPGYLISETMVLETRDGDTLARATRLSKSWLGTALNVERVESRYSRERHRSNWSLILQGDTVSEHLVSPTLRTQGRILLPEQPTAAVAIPYRLALGGGLAPGRTRTYRTLDGWPPAVTTSEVTVGRDSRFRYVDSSVVAPDGVHWVAAHVDSTRSFSVVMNGARGPRRLWVDHHGEVSAMTTLFGLRWSRTDFDLSATEFRKTIGERSGAIRGAVPTLEPFAKSQAARDTATADREFLVEHRDGSPVDAELLRYLAGGRQSLRGDTLIVHGEQSFASDRTESARDTTPDPLIQSDAMAILKLERSMVTAPLDRSRLPALMLAFRALIQVDTSAAAAEDALGTLGAHAGRPDGVSRLFVALLRSAGLPARYAVGIYAQGDTLYTHAWVEVWARQVGWYAVDPATGTVPASTGLVRVAFSGSSHPDEMLALLANARLTEIGRKEAR
jgi:transglutaminase-like putative cysteine protease